MPDSKIIDTINSFFAPKKELSTEEWSMLIEARLASIRPYLNSISFPKLGELVCLKGGHFLDRPVHAPKEDTPKVWISWITDLGGEEIRQADNLDMQGWFFGPYRTDWVQEGRTEWWDDRIKIPGSSCGIRYHWGVIRQSGVLVVVKIHFTCEIRSGMHYERATMIYLEKVTPISLEHTLRQSPKTIFLRLGEKIEEWEQARARLYEWARLVAQEVRDANKLLASFGQI